ncbi:hypothetical protein [Rheinheimera oceanensis]|uniref:hypothetical protein n=1 Tax=Rheinheimera oceanensis TaxID=2817449 RepID=UPI001BFD6BC1|nr:hypothetical protein [Rheinheimera oceanensis]
MRFLLLLLAAIVLLSCSEPDAVSAPKQPENITKHDPKQYSSLNEQLVYTARFAEIFGLDPANAIKLDPSVLAIRIYWTVFANQESLFSLYEPHEYRDNLPSMRIQLFLDRSIPVNLSREEGTLYNYESFVRSGFRYFQHKPPQPTEEMEQSDYQEFYNRIILSSNVEGSMTSTINRYKRTLVPGVTAIEFDGGLYKAPFAIFLYIGNQPASPEIVVPQQDRVALSNEDYDPALFFRIRVPDEMTPVLNQPYRE